MRCEEARGKKARATKRLSLLYTRWRVSNYDMESFAIHLQFTHRQTTPAVITDESQGEVHYTSHLVVWWYTTIVCTCAGKELRTTWSTHIETALVLAISVMFYDSKVEASNKQAMIAPSR